MTRFRLLTFLAVGLALALVVNRLASEYETWHEMMEISQAMPTGLSLADASGEEIKTVNLIYRRRHYSSQNSEMAGSMFGQGIHVSETVNVQVSFLQALKGDGEFTITAPAGRVYEPAGPKLTNVRASFRLLPMKEWFHRGIPGQGFPSRIEFLSLTSDQLDYRDGKRIWKTGS